VERAVGENLERSFEQPLAALSNPLLGADPAPRPDERRRRMRGLADRVLDNGHCQDTLDLTMVDVKNAEGAPQRVV
jgi:hypothetical protein